MLIHANNMLAMRAKSCYQYIMLAMC